MAHEWAMYVGTVCCFVKSLFIKLTFNRNNSNSLVLPLSGNTLTMRIKLLDVKQCKTIKQAMSRCIAN